MTSSKALSQAREDQLALDKANARSEANKPEEDTQFADPVDYVPGEDEKPPVEEKPDEEQEDEPEAPETDEVHEDESEQLDSELDDTPEFSDELVSLAEDYGLEPEDFPTERALERAVSAIDKVALKGTAKAEPVEEKPESQTEEVEEMQAEFDAALGLDDDEDFDPKLLKAIEGKFKQLHDTADSKVKAEQKAHRETKKQLEQLLERQQEQEQVRFTEWADSQFDSLPEEYQAEFGKGSYKDVRRRQFEKRQEVIDTYIALQERLPERGINLSPEKLFERAVNATNVDVSKKAAKAGLRKKASERRKQGVQRATGRKSKKTGGAAAADFVATWQKEHLGDSPDPRTMEL